MTDYPGTTTALDQATELRGRLALAEAATTDAIAQLAECQALPAMTRRTLHRVLGEVRTHLVDAHRMAETHAVLGAQLLDTTWQGELQHTALCSSVQAGAGACTCPEQQAAGL